MPSPPLKLAVLLSGSGTTLQNLVEVIGRGELDARVEVVVGSRPGLKGMERASAAGLRNTVVERAGFPSCAEFSRRVFSICDEVKPDLVVLAGWLCLLELPDRYAGRVMNIHPALLPSFGGKGMYGRRVHEAVLAHGCKVSGCTVHFVDNTYDTGPIILQRVCAVLEDDTPDSLARRVFEEEKVAYPEAIRLYQRGRLRVEGRRVRVLP
ncbi:MAG TPA: phosphoribosylglycinamide formyltransferase [Tepidisphaeraceae bacterium]|nr:phosphoribosylglycinamide formyltransferase [Tepidisphaeraceae bacterium]